jgi:hypothetical protein
MKIAIVCRNDKCSKHLLNIVNIPSRDAEMFLESFGHGIDDSPDRCLFCDELGVAEPWDEYIETVKDTVAGLITQHFFELDQAPMSDDEQRLHFEDFFEKLQGQFVASSFILTEETDHEDDNVKIFHWISDIDGEQTMIDHSPYEHIDRETFARYCKFFEKHGRFPSRNDIQSCGPLHNEDLIKLTEEA